MEKLPEIYDRLGDQTPQFIQGFLGQCFNPAHIRLAEAKFLKLFEKYQKQFQKMFNELLALWNTSEHGETLGHDKVHITFELYEFLQLIKNVKLKQSEIYMVMFGVLLHDLGRYPELLFKERSEGMDFSLLRQIQFHAALSGHIWLLVSEKHESAMMADCAPDMVLAWEAFKYRVLGAVLYHGGRNEVRDIVAHHVQSCDRLAGILGVREFVRNIICDGVQRGAAVYPNLKFDYSRTFPMFNNLPVKKFADAEAPGKSWTNILHYIEMPMRNLFQLSTEFGMERAKAMRVESGIILTLMSGGPDSDLCRQVFAPELNSAGEFKFPKTRLPQDIWEAIRTGMTFDEKGLVESRRNLSLGQLIDKMLDQQAPDISEIERGRVQELLDGVAPTQQGFIKETLQYVVSCREINELEERDLLASLREDKSFQEDPLLSVLVEKLWQSRLFKDMFVRADKLFVVTYNFNGPNNLVGLDPADSRRTSVRSLFKKLGVPEKELSKVYDLENNCFQSDGRQQLASIIKKTITFYHKLSHEDGLYLTDPETFNPQ